MEIGRPEKSADARRVNRQVNSQKGGWGNTKGQRFSAPDRLDAMRGRDISPPQQARARYQVGSTILISEGTMVVAVVGGRKKRAPSPTTTTTV